MERVPHGWMITPSIHIPETGTGAVTLQCLGGLNGGHSPHLEESPSQMHNLSCEFALHPSQAASVYSI